MKQDDVKLDKVDKMLFVALMAIGFVCTRVKRFKWFLAAYVVIGSASVVFEVLSGDSAGVLGYWIGAGAAFSILGYLEGRQDKDREIAAHIKREFPDLEEARDGEAART